MGNQSSKKNTLEFEGKKIKSCYKRKNTIESEYQFDPSKLVLDFVSTNYENKMLEQQKMMIEAFQNDEFEDKKTCSFDNCKYFEDEETCECTKSLSFNERKNKFDKKNNLIRNKYYACLLKKGLWNNPMEKSVNNIVIFDWDDTIMFSSEYHNFRIFIKDKEEEQFNGVIPIKKQSDKTIKSYNTFESSESKIMDFNKNQESHYSYDMYNLYNTISVNATNYNYYKPLIDELKANFDKNSFKSYFYNKLPFLKKLRIHIQKLFTLCIKESDVFIVSNAKLPWIYFTAITFFPEFSRKILEKVKIISARDHFSNETDINQWKYYCFKRISRSYNRNLKTNLIVIGDSNSEIEAAQRLRKEFRNIDLKTIKLKEKPSIEVMTKQLDLLVSSFPSILNKEGDCCIVVNNK